MHTNFVLGMSGVGQDKQIQSGLDHIVGKVDDVVIEDELNAKDMDFVLEVLGSFRQDADFHDKEYGKGDDVHVQNSGNVNYEAKGIGFSEDDSNNIDEPNGDYEKYFDGHYTDSKNNPDSANGVPNADKECGKFVKGNEEQQLDNGKYDG